MEVGAELATDAEIAAVVRLVKEFRSRLDRGEQGLELEVRLGHYGGANGRGYSPGVSRDTIEKAIRLMKTNPRITEEDWAEHHDFYYKFEGRTIRTRVTFDASLLRTRTQSVHKSAIGHVFVCVAGMCVRVALSKEEDVASLPVTTQSEYMRIQQRKTMLWGAEDDRPPPWKYDFSLTWAGRNKSEAETQQGKHAPVYEVEIELARPNGYVAQHSDDHIARSLLMKARDFGFGRATAAAV